MKEIRKGDYLGRGNNKKKVLEVIQLSNGWFLVKTENSKSARDFKVRVIIDSKFYTPKYAHFIIDFYGKFCQDEKAAQKVFDAIIETWQGADIRQILEKYQQLTKGLAGYDLEYILYTLNWILEQEDVNFKGRSAKLQDKLNRKLAQMGITPPPGRDGSQLPISLFWDILNGLHPVEVLLSAGLDIAPRRKR
ncbi:hypothetical protein [Thermocrinis sp.]